MGAFNRQTWDDSFREMARHFPPSASELTVLDVHPGRSTSKLMKYRPDLHMIGLECFPTLSYLALPKLDLVRGSITHFPLEESTVDAVIGTDIFTRISQHTEFLAEAKRVLRPGGRLILLDTTKGYSLPILRWAPVLRPQFTLQQMAEMLSDAGFARILTERTLRGSGILSRGEKPYPTLSTRERITRTAARDEQTMQIIDSAYLPTVGRGNFVFLLVKQSPNKPAWVIQPGLEIRWDAAMVTDDEINRPYLLAFTSLPKAVEFMQPAVTSGLIGDITKVAKFDKAVAPRWAVDLLLNPSLEAIQHAGRYTFNRVWLPVDPHTAVTGEE